MTENKFKMTEESLTTSLAYIQQETLALDSAIYDVNRPENEQNTYYSFKMIISHTNIGWEYNKTDNKEIDVPHELNEKILSMIKEYYKDKQKQIKQKQHEIIERFVKEQR